MIVLGIVFILYGILVFMIGSGTRFFAVWIALGGAAIVCSLMFRYGIFEKMPKALLMCLAGLVLAGVVVLVICEIIILRDFKGDKPQEVFFGTSGTPEVGVAPGTSVALDYLIVLGAQVRNDGLSPVLAHRLDTAAEYLLENPSTICIVTGGQGYNEPVAEGTAMKEYLISRGIGESRIIAETEAVNTVQNIQFSKPFLSSENAYVGIVTSNFHLARAKAIARKQGLTNVRGLAAPSDLYYLPNNMLREAIGLVKDFVFGNL